LLAAILWADRNENRNLLLVTKSCLSVLFVLVAWWQKWIIVSYAGVMLGGLICCLLGDVFLVFQNDRSFLLGLISFLLGHLLYLTAFIQVACWGSWALFGGIACVLSVVLVLSWLWDHLGSMRVPVIVYTLVIAGMVIGALGVFGCENLSSKARLAVLLGAVLFFISDLFVANERFKKHSFVNRLLGLPLYYGGQFLLAISLGWVG
jgi:uncharacterized membrane protein YhhN